MKRTLRFAVLAATLMAWPATGARAQVLVYDQAPDGSGTIVKSAIVPPDGVDGNEMTYERFSVASSWAITEIHWRGGYTNFLYGVGESPVQDFMISIYPSIGGGTQPDLAAGPLVQYTVGGNAGEAFAGNFGGVPMYDYQFALPSSFMAVGGTPYWLQIVALQMPSPSPYFWPPDWGQSAATGGDGAHFRAILGGTGGGGTLYQSVAGDVAFSLFTSSTDAFTISAGESPAGSGTILGAGPYPGGSVAALVATPNPGFGFLNWTEGGVQVSTSPTYSFTVTADRTLVANFVNAYTITTSTSPRYGGTTSGGGLYNEGSTVTVVATADPGWQFIAWTESGTQVSNLASYSFPAGASRALVANFTTTMASALFDFDTGYPALSTGQSLPFSQLAGGITAYFSSPDGPAFSLQTDASTQWHMPWFSGHYLYDNNLNRNRLDITFDQYLGALYLTFATADFNQNEIPTDLQVTGYVNSTANPPVGSATAHGAYIGATMPMGTLSFHPGVLFNMVEIVLPYQPLGSTDFFLDDLIAAVGGVTAVSDRPASGKPTLTLAPNPARGSMALYFEMAQTGRARVAVFDLSGRLVRELVSGTYSPGVYLAPWDGRGDSGARVAAGAYFVRFDLPGRTITRKALMLH